MINLPFSVPGTFASTLDTNKYKFLTKLALDDMEIVKCKFMIESLLFNHKARNNLRHDKSLSSEHRNNNLLLNRLLVHKR